MDQDLIKALIDALEASSLSELEYSKDGTTLRLVKQSGSAPAVAPQVATPRAAAPATVAAPASSTITAPMFGVAHLEPTPGAPPFVTAGQAVVAGQVLCLIEAMKVFAQLPAEQDGTIAAVLVRSGQDVEAGQPLFRLA